MSDDLRLFETEDDRDWHACVDPSCENPGTIAVTLFGQAVAYACASTAPEISRRLWTRPAKRPSKTPGPRSDTVADRVTQAAIDRVQEAAHDAWLDAARTEVETLARTGREFTTDDVWTALEPLDVETHEPRAMGAVIRGAAHDGLIERTGAFIESERVEAHRNPKAVWIGTGR